MWSDALGKKLRGVCDFLFKKEKSALTLGHGYLNREPLLPPKDSSYEEKTKWFKKQLSDNFSGLFEKQYDLKSFLRDLISSASEPLKSSLSEDTPVYNMLNVIYNLKEFRQIPSFDSNNNLGDELHFSYTECSEVYQILLIIYHLLSDQTLIEPTKDFCRQLIDTLIRFFEAFIQRICSLNTLKVNERLQPYYDLNFAFFKVLLVEKNMIIFNELLENGGFKRFLSLYQYPDIFPNMLEIFEEIVRHGAHLPKFLALLQETAFLDKLLCYVKFSDIKSIIKVFQCITRFSDMRINMDIFKEVIYNKFIKDQ